MVQLGYELPYRRSVRAPAPGVAGGADGDDHAPRAAWAVDIVSRRSCLEPARRPIRGSRSLSRPARAAGRTSAGRRVRGPAASRPWPRTLALTLAGVIVGAGIWAAVTAPPPPRRVRRARPPSTDFDSDRTARRLPPLRPAARARARVAHMPRRRDRRAVRSERRREVHAPGSASRRSCGPPPARSATASARGRAGDALRSRIGVLGHDLFLYGDLTARENLEFFGRLYGVAHARVARGRRPWPRTARGSRGRSRRVVLSRHAAAAGARTRAAARPRLVLLDEPFTGLDEESASLLRRSAAALSVARARSC